MSCPNCGQTLSPSAAQCPHCGQVLGKSAFPQAAQAGANPFADAEVFEAAVIPPAPRRLEDDPALRLVIPVGQSPWAILSGYLGLISLAFCFLGPVAVVTGLLAIRQIRANPQQHGTYRAVIGLVLGSLSTLGLIAVIVMVLAGK